MRVGARHGRATEQIGPFLATFTAYTDNPYLNYALPDDGATPSSAEVAALITAFEGRVRRPRLEYVSRLAPAVEPALLAAGFAVEDRLPLMICNRGEERAVVPPPGIAVVRPTTDAELFGLLAAQNEAYGGSAPEADAVEQLQTSLESGTMALLARVAGTGEVVGGGCAQFRRTTSARLPGSACAQHSAGVASRAHSRPSLYARPLQLVYEQHF